MLGEGYLRVVSAPGRPSAGEYGRFAGDSSGSGGRAESCSSESVTQQVFVSQVEAVVVGYDKYFNLMKLLKACSYLRQPTCHFIATNEDHCLPSNTHVVFPGGWGQGLVVVVSVSPLVGAGTGCLVQAVAFGSERKPTVVGKPHPPLLNVIQERLERREGLVFICECVLPLLPPPVLTSPLPGH